MVLQAWTDIRKPDGGAAARGDCLEHRDGAGSRAGTVHFLLEVYTLESGDGGLPRISRMPTTLPNPDGLSFSARITWSSAASINRPTTSRVHARSGRAPDPMKYRKPDFSFPLSNNVTIFPMCVRSSGPITNPKATHCL